MDILSLCCGRGSVLAVVTVMLLIAHGHEAVSEAFSLSQCECGGEEKCECSAIMAPPPADSRCNTTHRVIRHCKEFAGLASSKVRRTHTLPAGCTAMGQVQNIVAKYSVYGDQQSLYLSWDPPARVDLSLGYEVVVATQVTSLVEMMTECASIIVPPCVYRINILKGSHNNRTGHHYIAQCLRGLIHSTKTVHITAKFISYPIVGSFLNAEIQAPMALIKVPSCVEIAKESVLKLTKLCKIKLTYLPPRVEDTTFHITTLPNSSYLVTWEINSTLPLASAVLIVYQGYNSTTSYSGLAANEMNIARLPILTSKTFDSPTTGEPMSFMLVLKDAPPVNAVAYVQMALSIDLEAAHAALLNDTEYLEALEDDLDLEKGTIAPARAEERARAFLDELMEDRDSTRKELNLTVNGGWSEWKSSSPCRGCDVLPKVHQTRTCTNPAPSLYGTDCEGPSQQSVTCMATCYRDSDVDKPVPAAGGKETLWFRRPVFYATMATVVGIAVLIFIFIKRSPWMRSRKPAPRPMDGTRDIEQYTARPFTPPTYQGSHGEEKPDFNPPVLDVHRPQSPDSIGSCDSTASLMSLDSEAVRPRPSPQPPRTAYISYSRSSESHARNVLEFVDWLAYYDITAHVDQYDTEHFCHDMHGWIENRVTGADWIIVVLSRDYFNEWHGNEAAAEDDQDGGHEVRLETRLIKTMLAQPGNSVVPVFLGNYYDRCAIPALLESNKSFRVTEDDPRQARTLLSHLHGVEEYARSTY